MLALVFAYPLCGLALAPQVPVLQERWTHSQDDPSGPTIEWAASVAISSAHEIFVVGTRTLPYRAAVSKYDAHGTVVWSRELDFGAPTADVEGVLIARDSHHDVVVVGTIDKGLVSGKDLAITKLSGHSGADLWHRPRIIDGRASGDDLPRQVLLDDAGDIYLAAHLHDPAPLHLSDIGLFKIDGRAGDLNWNALIRGASSAQGIDVEDRFGEMAFLSTRALALVGTRIDGGYGGTGPILGEPILEAFDPAIGVHKPLPFAFPQPHIALSHIRAHPTAGAFVVAGSTFNGFDVDLFAAKYTNDHRLLWSSSFSPTGVANEWIRGVDIAPSGDVVLVGTSDHAYDMTWFTFLYRQPNPLLQGAVVLPTWGRHFQAGSQANGVDQPRAAYFDAQGNIAIGGVAECGPLFAHRMVELRYSRDGNMLPGSPLFASGWSSLAPDVVHGSAFDRASGESAWVGFDRALEAGANQPLPNWAVFRTGL